jgi:hypothetical protein
MPITIVARDAVFTVPGDGRAGERLLLEPHDFVRATGWEPKPQGLCRDEACVPLPPARAREIIGADGRVDLAAATALLDMPVVADAEAGVWSVGESPKRRRATLRSLEAPDFTLPDLDGNLVSLSDFRGRKVLLLSWASW